MSKDDYYSLPYDPEAPLEKQGDNYDKITDDLFLSVGKALKILNYIHSSDIEVDRGLPIEAIHDLRNQTHDIHKRLMEDSDYLWKYQIEHREYKKKEFLIS